MKAFGIAGLVLTLLAPSALLAQERLDLGVAPEGNEARYRVREQLANIEFPSDAVGRTAAVTGRILIVDGAVVRDSSRFTINVATLETDSRMRDGYVRRNTLETEEHPEVVFVPTSLEGLTFPVPAAGAAAFRMVGDLTIRGVTKPATWEVSAKFDATSVSGQATTSFTFVEFEMEKPSVARVLSVADDIRLEYDFRLVRRGSE